MYDILKIDMGGCLVKGIEKVLIRGLSVANDVADIANMHTSGVTIENVYYISQIIAGVFVILGTVIAVWQYVLSARDSIESRKREYQLHEKEIFDMEKDRIQKAIDLAGYYKDNILQNIMLIKHVYQWTGIQEILDKINFQNISHFDIIEMEDNISLEDRKIITNASNSRRMSDTLIMVSEVVKIWDDCKEVNVIEEDGKKVRKLTVSQNALLYKFQTVLNGILNNLEFFAMHFTHGTADDSVIYQSLHQSYIDVVRTLYYDIAANNVPGESKLYTNVIELYNKWVIEADKQKENETAAARENISKGKSLK